MGTRPTAIKQLQDWLKEPTNSLAKMAHLLGYEETTAVKNWIKTGRVPQSRERQLIGVIDSDQRGINQKLTG